MYYSDAIRLGGMMRPKCQGEFYDFWTGGVCVQGAALNAMGALTESKRRGYQNRRKIRELFPDVHRQHVDLEDVGSLPDLVRFTGTILEVSVGLNDYTDWTRERIADWVEAMEWKYGIRTKGKADGEATVVCDSDPHGRVADECARLA